MASNGSSVFGLFSDPYSYSSSNFLNMHNQNEQRKLEREKMAHAAAAGNAEREMDLYKSQVLQAFNEKKLSSEEARALLDEQGKNKRSSLERQSRENIAAARLGQDQERLEFDKGKFGLEHELNTQKAGLQALFQDRQAGAMERNAATAEGRLDLERGKEAKKQMEQEFIAKAYQENGLEGMISAYGQLGRGQEASQLKQGQALYQKTMYEGEKSLAEAVTKGKQIEAGDKLRKLRPLMQGYLSLVKTDPETANYNLRMGLLNTPGLEDLDKLNDSDLLNVMASEYNESNSYVSAIASNKKAAQANAGFLTQIFGQNDSRARAEQTIYGETQSQESKYAPSEVTKMQQERDKAKAEGRDADAEQLDSALSAKTNVSKEGTKSTLTKAEASRLQEALRLAENSAEELAVLKESVDKEADKVLGLSGTIDTALAEGADFLFSGDISERDKAQLQAVTGIIDRAEQWFQTDWRKPITGASAAIGELKQLRESVISGKFSKGPTRFKQQLNTILTKFERSIERDRQRLRDNGYDVSTKKQLPSFEQAEQYMRSKGLIK